MRSALVMAGTEGRSDAMRLAAKTVRSANPHPYDWAPFIVIGQSARLEGAAGAAIPLLQPIKRGIVVTPIYPFEPIIIGPHGSAAPLGRFAVK